MPAYVRHQAHVCVQEVGNILRSGVSALSVVVQVCSPNWVCYSNNPIIYNSELRSFWHSSKAGIVVHCPIMPKLS